MAAYLFFSIHFSVLCACACVCVIFHISFIFYVASARIKTHFQSKYILGMKKIYPETNQIACPGTKKKITLVYFTLLADFSVKSKYNL